MIVKHYATTFPQVLAAGKIMKLRTSQRNWLWTISIFALLIGALQWSKRSYQRSIDLGNKPPAHVFARIFQMPVPFGVTHLQIAGEAHLSGIFWMKFQCDDIDSTLREFKRNAKVPLNGPTDTPNLLPSENEIAHSRYANKVQWQAVRQIAKPEYYEFTTQPMGTGWVGTLTIDRPHKIVYANGGLM